MPAAGAPDRCTIEPSRVSITTATMSSMTVTVIAIWLACSCELPSSCWTLLMIADDDVTSMAARNNPCMGSQPAAVAIRRVR